MKIRERIHLLGLDAVFGAMAISCLAAVTLQVNPGIFWWLSLGLTTWLAYTGDRVRDAWKYRKKDKTRARQFILRNMSILLWVMMIVAFVDGVLMMNFLDRQILRLGLFVAGLGLVFSALRFMLRRSRVLRIPGELFALLFLMAGTWLGPWAGRQEVSGNEALSVFVLCGMVQFLNLGVVSLNSPGQHSRMGLPSLPALLGGRSTRALLFGIVAAVFLLSLLQFMVWGMNRSFSLSLILDGMAAVYFLMLLWPGAFGKGLSTVCWAALVPLMGFLALLARFTA